MSNMRFIEPPQPNDRVVAAEIDGRLTAEDMDALIGAKIVVFQTTALYQGNTVPSIQFRAVQQPASAPMPPKPPAPPTTAA